MQLQSGSEAGCDTQRLDSAELMSKPKYTLTLEAQPSKVPATVRLRRLLKTMLRSYGFRCTAIRETESDDGRRDPPNPHQPLPGFPRQPPLRLDFLRAVQKLLELRNRFTTPVVQSRLIDEIRRQLPNCLRGRPLPRVHPDSHQQACGRPGGDLSSVSRVRIHREDFSTGTHRPQAEL